MKRILFILILFILTYYAAAQVIPEERRVNWSVAGYQGEKPNPDLIADVTDFGAVGDSLTDNYNAIINATNSLEGNMGYIYFPPGGYVVNSTISLPDSVILLGATSDSTELIFDLDEQPDNCFTIKKTQSNTFVPIVSGFEKGSGLIEVSNSSQFIAGDYAEIREENGDWDTKPISWADYSVGQIVKITGKSDNKLYLKNPLRIDYEESLNPEIRRIYPKYNVGIECLKVSRIDEPASGAGYNFLFDYAVQCWIIGVESNKSVGSHIYISRSSNIDISGCYIHDAFTYDGSGTRGYGILINHHAGECLVENNILKHLRHALIVKTGANGNVIAYNYSIEPYRSEPVHDFSGDISLHGHYAFCNLFESNIVQNIIIDHYWGPSGPYNTFFRNRAELYGIIMTTSDTTQTKMQNFVGNEVTNMDPFYGNYTLTGINHFQYGNNIRGNIIPSGTDDLTDESYYLEEKPVFWDISSDWPSMGIPNELGEGNIPANIRYIPGSTKTICRDTGTSTQVNLPASRQNKAVVWPNPFSNELIVFYDPENGSTIQIQLINNIGIEIYKEIHSPNDREKIKIILNNDINDGIYFLKIIEGNKIFVRKVLKIK